MNYLTKTLDFPCKRFDSQKLWLSAQNWCHHFLLRKWEKLTRPHPTLKLHRKLLIAEEGTEYFFSGVANGEPCSCKQTFTTVLQNILIKFKILPNKSKSYESIKVVLKIKISVNGRAQERAIEVNIYIWKCHNGTLYV